MVHPLWHFCQYMLAGVMTVTLRSGELVSNSVWWLLL